MEQTEGDDADQLRLADMEFECVLGYGAFGEVAKFVHKKTKQLYAVKRGRFNILMLLTGVRPLEKEIEVIQNIPVHECLVKFHGFEALHGEMILFMEYMPKGSVRSIIDRDGPLKEDVAGSYMRNVLQGLEFLHENNVLHRDIKCGNILIGSRNEVKLTDFGLSKIVEDSSNLENHTFCGTMHFMAPEMFSKEKYCSAVDIWATGVTAVEMRTGNPIYFNLRGTQLIQKICDPRTNVIKDIPITLSKPMSYFLQLAFVQSPNRRANAKDLLHTKFILDANT